MECLGVRLTALTHKGSVAASRGCSLWRGKEAGALVQGRGRCRAEHGVKESKRVTGDPGDSHRTLVSQSLGVLAHCLSIPLPMGQQLEGRKV